MGSVITTDDFDRAISQAFDESFAIVMSAKRRVHFEIGIVRRPDWKRMTFRKGAGENLAIGFPESFTAGDRGVSEGEMMGTGFARNGNAALLGFTNETNALGGAQVLAMDMCAREFGEENISSDNDFFAEGGPAPQTQFSAVIAFMHDAVAHERVVLAMIKHREVEHPRV